MICIHCGNSIPNDSAFCSICGKETEWEKRLNYRPSAVPEIQAPEEAKEKAEEEIPVLEESSDDTVPCVPVFEEEPVVEIYEETEGEEVINSKKFNTLPKLLQKLLRDILPIFFAVLLTFNMCSLAYADNPVQNARNSVVRVAKVFYWDGEPISDFLASGTGICVGDEGNGPSYILTNRHVVEREDEDFLYALPMFDPVSYRNAFDTFITVKIFILTDTGVYSVDYDSNVTLSKNADLALVHLSKPLRERQAASFGKSEDLHVTDTVYAIGFPGLADVDDNAAANTNSLESYLREALPSSIDEMTVTQGTVSRKDVTVNGISHIQHEADISHGNSGGPLVDSKGNVVGVNTWISIDSDAASKKQYAIDIDAVKSFLNSNHVSWKEAKVAAFFKPWMLAAAVVALIIIIVAVSASRRKPASASIPAGIKTAPDYVPEVIKPPESDRAAEEDKNEPVVFVYSSLDGKKEEGRESSSSGDREYHSGFLDAEGFVDEDKHEDAVPVAAPAVHMSFGKKDIEKVTPPEDKKQKQIGAGFTDITDFDV